MPDLVLVPFEESQLSLAEPWFDDSDTRRELGDRAWVRMAIRLMETQPGTSDGDRTVMDRIVWVAYDAGIPVGLIDVETYDDATAGFALVVAPEHRRRGVGRRIIRTVIEQPRHTAVAIWTAGVDPSNEASARCLVAAGFTPRSTTPDHQGMLNYQRPTQFRSRHPAQ